MEHRTNCRESCVEELKSRAVFSDVYSFFDITIAVKSDRKELLDGFRYIYSRFLIPDAGQKIDATYYMVIAASESPLVIAEENSHPRVISLNYADSARFYAYMLVSDYIAVNLKSHLLIHAAALSRKDEGLAIVGASCSGKTTLTLKLFLEKNFGFLSDEQLAINRTTHLIDPFPRSIGIREDTLALLGDLNLGHLEAQAVEEGKRRWFVDISDISEGGIGSPCCLKYLVFLVNSINKTEKERQPTELTVDKVNKDLLEKIRVITGVKEIRYVCMGDYYVLNFCSETGVVSPLELRDVCKSCDVWLFGMREVNSFGSSFQMTPQIKPISWDAAAMRLLRSLKSDFIAVPAEIFLELAELLEGVQCYEMSVGRLDEMAELVCELMSASEK